MSKIYTVPELQSVLSPIFRANGVRKATLFGSYAKGVATARSDVDLLVDSGLRGFVGGRRALVTTSLYPRTKIERPKPGRNWPQRGGFPSGRGPGPPSA